MGKKSSSKRGKKWDIINPENRVFGEIILSGFVYDVYKDGKYVASFIASYPTYPTLSLPASLDRKIENIQNIVKDVVNDYLKSDEFKTSVLNIIREDFRFLQTNESKTDPEDDPDEKISLGKQLQNYIDGRIDRKIEERMKKYDESFKRIEEDLSKLLTREDKQPKVESELNDVVKQLHELKERLDEITKLLPLVKESTPQAVQTMGEKVYTSTPPQIVQTTPQTISPAEKPEKPPSSLVSPPSPPPEYETPYNLYKKLSSNKEIGLEDIQEYDKVLHSILSDVVEHKVNETILTKYIEWERKERGDPKQYLPLIDAAWKYGIKLNPAEEELVRKWNKKTPKVHIEGEIKLFEE